jgi:lipoic acid synthetase
MKSGRLPSWLRVKQPAAGALAGIGRHTLGKGLATVCEQARCPNRGKCFSEGTATLLILGKTCTRNCAFCAVTHGTPEEIDPDEPRNAAESVAELGLKHAVITSVTRDDLTDGGAAVFAATVRAIRDRCPGTSVELLIPDFRGSVSALREVADSGPDVLGHNLETVPRLYGRVRKGADYDRSLELLERVSSYATGITTKSGIMLGLGESREEVLRLVKDLVDAGCRVLTMGQYLRPTSDHHPVERYLRPEEFDELRESALELGMLQVAAAPFVRSSFRAGEMLQALRDSCSEDRST